MSFSKETWSRNGFKIVACLALFITILSFYNRYIQADDNWFGEQAYWLATEGTVKLKSLPLIFNWTEEFLVYHKLLIWMGAGVVTVFGWSVYPLKALVFLFYTASIFLIFRSLKKEGSTIAWLAVALFIIIPMSLIKSFEFRPEIPMMFFGFLSYCLIQKHLKCHKWLFLVAAALTAGLSFLTHLNAATFCVSGTLILLANKKVKASFVFAFIGMAVCLIYFVPYLLDHNLDIWFYNLKNWPSHAFEKNVDSGFIAILKSNALKIIGEQKRFFWDDTVAGISVLFFLSLLLKFKWLWKEHRFLLLYTLFQITFLAFLGSHKAPRYLVLHFPFMVSVIAITFHSFQTVMLKRAFIFLFTGQMILFGFNAFKIFKRNQPHVTTHEHILSNIPKGNKVLAPWDFIYNSIDSYHLHSYKTYEYLQERMDHKFSQQEFFEQAKDLDMDYIIVDKKLAEKYHWWIYEGTINRNSLYEVDKDLDRFFVLSVK